MSFCYVLCVIPENVYGARKKKRAMDWQLVASYFTVKSTDIFCSVGKQTLIFFYTRKPFCCNLFSFFLILLLLLLLLFLLLLFFVFIFFLPF